MKLLIRVDASSQIGTGHLMRCLALAQAWQSERGEVIFAKATSAPALESRVRGEGFMVSHLSATIGSQADANQTIALAQQLRVDRVVVDGYHFGAEFQQGLKTAGLRVLFIDDNGHAERYVADWVMNQNIHAHESLYPQRSPHTQLLLGTRYALLRKEFWPWRGWQRQLAPVARKVLVTLGGGDPDNVTLKVIRALQQIERPDLEAVVVVGGSNPYYKTLQKAVEESTVKIELRRNVSNMPALMAWADIAIAGGGSTCWELAFMGVPSLVITLADNQGAIAKELDNLGAAQNLGWHDQVSPEKMKTLIEELMTSEHLRSRMLRNSQSLVDAHGASRIVEILVQSNL